MIVRPAVASDRRICRSILQNARAEAVGAVFVTGAHRGGGIVRYRAAGVGRLVATTVRAARPVGCVRAKVAAVLGAGHLPDDVRETVLVVAGVVLVVGADVAGLLGPLFFLLVRLQHRRLDDLAAGGVN